MEALLLSSCLSSFGFPSQNTQAGWLINSRNLLFTQFGRLGVFKVKLLANSVSGGFWFIDRIFWLCPYMVEGTRGLSGASLI